MPGGGKVCVCCNHFFYAATAISVTHVNPCTCDVFTLESFGKRCNVLSSLSCLGPFNPSINSTDAIVLHFNLLALVQKLYILLH